MPRPRTGANKVSGDENIRKGDSTMWFPIDGNLDMNFPPWLSAWNGSDDEFPIIVRDGLTPRKCSPFLGNTTTDIIHAARGSVPLDGIQTSVSWLTQKQQTRAFELIGWDTGREEMRYQYRHSRGFWFLRTMAHDNKISASLSMLGGEGWFCLGKFNHPLACGELAQKLLIMGHNVGVLQSRFVWSVTLKRGDRHVGISVPTDSSGILAMLRDRESYDKRRSPLLHWVQAHARMNRKNESATHEVRAFLRGKRVCKWHGFICEIRESEFERESLVDRK
jgi:hypothetical protein